jgi:hypothetical protein
MNRVPVDLRLCLGTLVSKTTSNVMEALRISPRISPRHESNEDLSGNQPYRFLQVSSPQEIIATSNEFLLAGKRLVLRDAEHRAITLETIAVRMKLLSAKTSINQYGFSTISLACLNLIKIFLGACSYGQVLKSEWCCFSFGEHISPYIASDNCVAALTASAIALKRDRKFLHYFLGVLCASLELSKVSKTDFQTGNVCKLWLTNHVCDVLNNMLDETCPLETRKLAWDVSFILTTCILKPGNFSLGFEFKSLGTQNETPYEIGTVELMLKVFNSVVAAHPAHIPFMPVEYFENVKWPHENADLCRGKLTSLFCYSNEDLSSSGHSENVFHTSRTGRSSTTNSNISSRSRGQSDGNSCSSECNDTNTYDVSLCDWQPSRRLMPWVEKFSFLGMLQLYKRLTWVKNSTSSSKTYSEVSAVIELLRCTLLEIYMTDPWLMKRDKTRPFIGARKGSSCENCNKKFRVLNSVLSSGQKLSCNICRAAICSDCADENFWNNERCCTSCKRAIAEIGLFQVTPEMRLKLNQVDTCSCATMPEGLKFWRDESGFSIYDHLGLPY